MRRIYGVAVRILLLIFVGLCINGCSSESSKVKDTLIEFEEACENVDIDAILNCIDPDVAEPVKLGLALYSEAVGQEYEDVTDSIAEAIFGPTLLEDSNTEDFWDTLVINDVKIKTDKDKAVATCTIGFQISGQEFEKDAEIHLVKKDDKWYISSVKDS